MRIFRSDSRIIFNVIIALVLGIFLGNFLGNTILSNQAINVNAGPYNDQIFIIQAGNIFYDETTATITLNKVKDAGLKGLIVKEHNKYYVYLGIAYRANQFDPTITVLEENNIDYFVKTMNLYSLLEGRETTGQDYYFYYQSIKHFLSLIHNEEVVFSEQYLDSISDPNLVIYNKINNLNTNLDRAVASQYKLEVYESLVDALM